MKAKFWNYLRGSNGYPISGATINVYAYPAGGGLPVYAYVYLTMGGSATTTENHVLQTDANGYFEFWVADIQEGGVNGYDFTTEFKITWEKLGVDAGFIDRVELFDVNNREVDETDSTNVLKNKMVSNYLANRWQSHLSVSTLDDHVQYLRTDATRSLLADWDIGLGRKILAPRISARSASETLRLTDYAGIAAITINPGGQVDIPNVHITGGTISGISLGLAGFSLDGGTLDDVLIGLTTPTSAAFTWVNIDGGFIDGTVIGSSVPVAGTFTTLIAAGAEIPTIYVNRIDFPTTYITDATLVGDWVCTGGFTANHIHTEVTAEPLQLQETVHIDGDTGNVSIGSVGTTPSYERQLTVHATQKQMKLKYSETSSTDFFADEEGGFTIESHGNSAKTYMKQPLDLLHNTLHNIGINDSAFTDAGDLMINGYCTVSEDYRINGDVVLSTTPTSGNIFVGFGAAESALGTSWFNTVLGHEAMFHMEDGSKNVFIGYMSGHNLVNNALNNICIGCETMSVSASGSNNVIIGASAGFYSAGQGNVFIGHKAGFDVTGISPSATESLYIANDAGMPLIYGSFSAGRIGLQTVAPDYTLDVVGDIRTEGLMVCGDTVPPSGQAVTHVGFTNEITAATTGAGTILMAGTAGASTGFIKIYVDNVAKYIPYYDVI